MRQRPLLHMNPRRPQAESLHPLNDAETHWPSDRVSLAGLVLTIAWIYVLGVLFQGVWW